MWHRCFLEDAFQDLRRSRMFRGRVIEWSTSYILHNVWQCPSSLIGVSRFAWKQGVSISELRWCRNSQKGSEPKNFKIWKSSLPYGGLWENEVINCHYHLHCIIPEIFRIVFGTFWGHSLLARNSPGWPGRKILLPSLPENFKIPGKSSAWLAWDTFHSRLARQEKSSAWPAWRVSSQ